MPAYSSISVVREIKAAAQQQAIRQRRLRSCELPFCGSVFAVNVVFVCAFFIIQPFGCTVINKVELSPVCSRPMNYEFGNLVKFIFDIFS